MTMAETTTALRDPEFMQAFLDVVIPPSADGRMPGAGGLRIEAQLAAEVEADPMVGPMVSAGLEAIRAAGLARNPAGFAALTPEERLAVVQDVTKVHGFLMFGVTRYAYMAYYQHPRVLEALGEPGRPPFPGGYSVEPTDPELLGLLAGRAKRG